MQCYTVQIFRIFFASTSHFQTPFYNSFQGGFTDHTVGNAIQMNPLPHSKNCSGILAKILLRNKSSKIVG